MTITARDATTDDIPFMRLMLYEAATVGYTLRNTAPPPFDEVLAQPSNRHYYEEWGRDGDIAVIAEEGGAPVGACWVRLFTPADRGNGVIAEPGTPELAIGVAPAHRGRGAGGVMLAALLERLRAAGYARAGLSVDPINPARRLYERHGFAPLPDGNPHAGTSVLMAVELSVST